MPLDHLNCFAVVLRGIHGKIDICQTDYSIHSKQRIFAYSNVIHGSTTFKLTKGYQENANQLLNLMFLFFLLFSSFQCTRQKFHKQKWYMLFFTCIKLVARMLVSACAITCINWRRLNNISYLTYLQYTDLTKAGSN